MAFRPLHPGRGDGGRQRPVVGDPHHGRVARRPCGTHRPPGRIPAPGAAVQPVHGRLGAERLIASAGGRAAGRVTGAEAVDLRDRVPARQEVVVGVAGERHRRADEPRQPGLVAEPPAVGQTVLVEIHRVERHIVAAAPVRTRLDDRGDPQPRVRLLRAQDPHPDRVPSAVVIAVRLGLDVDELRDGVGAGEGGFGPVADDLQRRLVVPVRHRRRECGEQGGGERGDAEPACRT